MRRFRQLKEAVLHSPIACFAERRTQYRLAGIALLYGVMAWQCAMPGTWDVPSLVSALVLGSMLVALTVIDLETLRLPDGLTLPLAMAGLVAQARNGWAEPRDAIVAAMAGFLVLYLVAKVFERMRGHAGLGGGDAKLFGAGGAWVGLPGLPVVLLVASVTGLAAAGIARLAGVPIDRRTRLPFGPFLAIAIWAVWLMGAEGLVALFERRI